MSSPITPSIHRSFRKERSEAPLPQHSLKLRGRITPEEPRKSSRHIDQPITLYVLFALLIAVWFLWLFRSIPSA